MIWSKTKKCRTCEKKLKDNIHEIRLQTADGIVILEICDECAEFFDKSADVLSRKGNDNETV